MEYLIRLVLLLAEREEVNKEVGILRGRLLAELREEGRIPDPIIYRVGGKYLRVEWTPRLRVADVLYTMEEAEEVRDFLRRVEEE